MVKKKIDGERSQKKPQRQCAAMEQHYEFVRSDSVYRDNRKQIEAFTALARRAVRSSIIKIPVVVHVLYNKALENISDDQIQSQIDILNKDFRRTNLDWRKTPEPFRNYVTDAGIEFGLARRDPVGRLTGGITRTKTAATEFAGKTNQLNAQIKFKGTGKAAWPATDYLNIWVCNLAGGLLGYAQFPGGGATTDGVVITLSAFGDRGTAEAPFNCGRTATHEIGHFFNLLHIWGDDQYSSNTCSGSDNVGDTPNQGGSNSGKPAFPNISCNNGPDGDMFMNYMDYVDDEAMFMFTKGQVERMDAALAGPRASLAQSQGLTPPETERLSLIKEDASNIIKSHLSEIGNCPDCFFDGISWVKHDK